MRSGAACAHNREIRAGTAKDLKRIRGKLGSAIKAEAKRFTEESSQLFFLLRYVNGGDLEQWIHDGRLYAGEEAEMKRVQIRVVRVTYELALGIGHSHERGIVHADVKPENVLMTGGGKKGGRETGSEGVDAAGPVGAGAGMSSDFGLKLFSFFDFFKPAPPPPNPMPLLPAPRPPLP